MGDSCQGIDGDGCSFTYTARNHGNVWVHVNGQRMDARYDARSMPYTVAEAGARTRDCPPDPDDGTDPGDGLFIPPVGPPTPGVGLCNTISCPHVQHTWGANPLEIHWTLRPAPPATPQ